MKNISRERMIEIAGLLLLSALGLVLSLKGIGRSFWLDEARALMWE